MISWTIMHLAWVYVGALFFLTAFGWIRARGEFGSLLPRRKEWLVAALLTLGAWAIRQFWVVHTHNVYFDEFTHMELARNLLETGLYASREISGDPTSPVLRVEQWPPAFHCLLAVAFFIGGIGETAAYALSALLGALGVMGAWFFARMLSFSPRAALATCAAVAFWPLHLRFSGGVSLETGAMAAILFAAGLAVAWVKTGSEKLFLPALSAVALAGLFRLEAVAAAACVPVVLWVWEQKKQKRMPVFGIRQIAMTALFFSPIALTALLGFGTYHDFRAGVSGTPFLQGLSFWLGGGLMPYGYSVAMALGFVYLVRHRIALAAGLLMVIVGMMAVVSIYIHMDAGLLDHQRFQLLCAPALVGFLAGAFEWANQLRKKTRYSFLLLTGIVYTSLLYHLPLVHTAFRPECEKEYRFVLKSRGELPRKALYIAPVPDILSATAGLSATSVDMFMKKGDALDTSKRRLIYFRDIWTYANPVHALNDKHLQDEYLLLSLMETKTKRGPIGFYEMISKKDAGFEN